MIKQYVVEKKENEETEIATHAEEWAGTSQSRRILEKWDL